jgi:hypothetical protein
MPRFRLCKKSDGDFLTFIPESPAQDEKNPFKLKLQASPATLQSDV